MADFRTLLSKPMAEAKRPPLLPRGTYHGITVSRELQESKEKKTPFVRYQVRLTGPGDDVDHEAIHGIELGKKTLRYDFFLTDDAAYRLGEFATSCGHSIEGMSWNETIEACLNVPVLVEVVHRNFQDGAEVFAEIRHMKGA